MVSTSANILHEFLICCYDPTLQILIRTAKWLPQNTLHGSDLTHKSNLMLICYLLVMSCYLFHFSQIISDCFQEKLHILTAGPDSAHSFKFNISHSPTNALLKYIYFQMLNWWMNSTVSFFFVCFFLLDLQVVHYWKIRVHLCPDVPWVSMIVGHWSQQPAYCICFLCGSMSTSAHSLWWVHSIPLFLWWIAWQRSFPWSFPHGTVNMCESSIPSTWRVSGFLVAQRFSCYRVT